MTTGPPLRLLKGLRVVPAIQGTQNLEKMHAKHVSTLEYQRTKASIVL